MNTGEENADSQRNSEKDFTLDFGCDSHSNQDKHNKKKRLGLVISF